MSGGRRRRLLHFLLAGTLAFAAARALEAAAPPPAAAPAGAAASDEALLAAAARRLGLDRRDPVVRRRLVANLRALGRTGSDEALWREALALAMDRSDPVVQRRLAERMEARLRAAARVETPDDAALRAWYRRHGAAWRLPPAVAFEHVLLARERRGAAAEADARALLAALRAGRIAPEVAARRGDPFALGARVPLRTLPEIAEHFGADFAAALGSLEPGAWSGPIASVWGWHVVRVRERRPARQPPLEAVRPAVIEAWRAARGDAAVRAALARLRAAHAERRAP